MQHRENISVKIFTISKDSPLISVWETHEGLTPGAILDEIERNFTQLEDLANQDDQQLLARNTSLVIRTHKDIQCFDISYAGKCCKTEDWRIVAQFFV